VFLRPFVQQSPWKKTRGYLERESKRACPWLSRRQHNKLMEPTGNNGGQHPRKLQYSRFPYRPAGHHGVRLTM